MSIPANSESGQVTTEEISRLISRWETDVVLADGGTVKIRPILPSDADLIVQLHSSLSPETIYLRFFSVIPKLSDSLLKRFVNVDYTDRMAFVAFLRDSIIAVARYDRLPGRSEAEVAFLVSDAHQGRGLGTIMLEMLAARASEAGITRFMADTLPENRRMLGVFHEAGYVESRSFKDGVVRVIFDIEPTAESIQKMYQREQRAVARSIGKILSPRSIAVVGASTTSGSIGNVLFRNILDSSFAGPVYPVNQHARSVSSVKAYPSLTDIPDQIDLAIIVVPEEEVFSVVRQAADKNVGGLVIISSGFSETGHSGAQKERELVRYARQNGMRIVGPNCMGVANTAAAVSLNATLATHALLPGKASLIAHSGALGLAIVEEARRRGIGLSTFVSSGNRADVSGNDLLHYWEQDENTKVILLYLESFGNPRSFVRIARRLSKDKAIVAVKAKRVATTPATITSTSLNGSQDGGSTTQGVLGAPLPEHLAAEIGTLSADEAVDAMFAHTGVLRVNSLEELFSLGNALATQPTPKGPRVAILSNTGGPVAIAQDSLERAGLRLSQFESETISRLTANLPDGARVSNPVELPANCNPKYYKVALEHILNDVATDAVLVLYVPTVTSFRSTGNDISPLEKTRYGSRKSLDHAVEDATEVATLITKVAGTQKDDSAKPVLANFLALPSVVHALKSKDNEVPAFTFPELAAQALGRMWEYQQWKVKPTGNFISHPQIQRAAAATMIKTWLSEAEELDHANDARYPITKDIFLSNNQVSELLKFYDIETHAPDYKKHNFDPSESVEIKLSVIHDMIFGPFITMALGGLLSDLLGQKATRVLPLRDLDARELIEAIPGSKIFNGYRSIPKLDTESLINLVSKIGQMVENHFEIANIAINPLVLTANGCQMLPPKIRLVDWAAQANYLMRGLS